ncbi:MAG: EAL domain-containing protein, partial [Xanthomonadaceae bacterium]|nr:EAL domain-containing protein [Xanthomonadaceae bacterium]
LMELESDLRRAIARSEFVPFFQPVVRLANRVTVGYEALLRWQHPERGLLLPADFLAVAEETGAAEQIDWQMFERTFEVAAPLLTGDAGFVAINVSGRHFRADALDENLLTLLRKHAIRPECVRIEVTERMLIENPPAAKRLLDAMRAHGIGVSLDDFGTGYSSLSYLHQYPVQALKIDRSFVAEMGSEKSGSSVIVRAILALAGALGMQVIAEGIETEAQHRTLTQLGCEFGQGFLYARPQPAHVWIDRNR